MDEVNLEHRMTRVEKLSEGNKRRIEDLEEDNKVLHDLASPAPVVISPIAAQLAQADQ